VEKRHGSAQLVLGFATIPLCGFIDYLTGNEISFSIFYLLPIALITWSKGLGFGLLASFSSAVFWLAAELKVGNPYMHWLVPYWNLLVRFGFFTVSAVLLSRVRQANHELEEKVAERTHELWESEAKISKINRLYAVLSNINQMIVRVRDQQKIFDLACQVAVDSGGFQFAWVGLIDRQTKQVVPKATAGNDNGYLAKLNITLGSEGLDYGPTEIALRTGKHVVVNDIGHDPIMATWREDALSRGYRGSVVLPIIVDGELRGNLNLYTSETNFFDAEEIKLLDELASDIGFAISFSEQELRRIQSDEELRILNSELEQRVAQRTAELNRLNIELQHANHVKDEFLASMSHELRTPLNSILGLSETLLEQRRTPLTEHQQNSLQIIESSGKHLLELINDVLDLSKIEAGKFDHYPQVVDVNTLCRSSLAFIREQAMRKSITLNYEEETTVSTIYADPRRLKQIIVNLLTNAVKFTPEGGQVDLQVHGDKKQDLVQFSVSDTGIGIAPDDLKTLFQPFVQVESSLNRQFEGTGLGLALVQKMVDMHGGSVEVESEVGKGSRFTVNLPWGRINVAQIENIESGGETPFEHHAPGQPETQLLQGVILLAEDNQANTLTISEYLESHGYRVVNAHDGTEAIEKAEETSPDIILMDIQMPVMDGLEAIRKLRTDPRFDPTPIIALTALAMPGDRERCLEAGANEYMSKPVILKKLLQTVKYLIANRQ
jgi:signal transduction histidine kinase/CheY-like chemotaxis protein